MPAGGIRTTKYEVKVTGAIGTKLRFKAGVITNSPIADAYPFDDYLSKSIPIN